jgi:hypothetical protein
VVGNQDGLRKITMTASWCTHKCIFVYIQHKYICLRNECVVISTKILKRGGGYKKIIQKL